MLHSGTDILSNYITPVVQQAFQTKYHDTDDWLAECKKYFGPTVAKYVTKADDLKDPYILLSIIEKCPLDVFGLDPLNPNSDHLQKCVADILWFRNVICHQTGAIFTVPELFAALGAIEFVMQELLPHDKPRLEGGTEKLKKIRERIHTLSATQYDFAMTGTEYSRMVIIALTEGLHQALNDFARDILGPTSWKPCGLQSGEAGEVLSLKDALNKRNADIARSWRAYSSKKLNAGQGRWRKMLLDQRVDGITSTLEYTVDLRKDVNHHSTAEFVLLREHKVQFQKIVDSICNNDSDEHKLLNTLFFDWIGAGNVAVPSVQVCGVIPTVKPGRIQKHFREVKLVGRETMVKQCTDALCSVGGACLLLRGEMGVGKSAVCRQAIRMLGIDAVEWDIWEWRGTTMKCCRDDLIRYAQNRFPWCKEILKSDSDPEASFAKVCQYLRQQLIRGKTPWLLYIDDAQDPQSIIDLLLTLFRIDPAEARMPFSRIIMSSPSAIPWDPELLQTFQQGAGTALKEILLDKLDGNTSIELLCEQAPEMKTLTMRFENLSCNKPKDTKCSQLSAAILEWSMKGSTNGPKRDFPVLKCVYLNFTDLLASLKALQIPGPVPFAITISATASPPIVDLVGQLADVQADADVAVQTKKIAP